MVDFLEFPSCTSCVHDKFNLNSYVRERILCPSPGQFLSTCLSILTGLVRPSNSPLGVPEEDVRGLAIHLGTPPLVSSSTETQSSIERSRVSPWVLPEEIAVNFVGDPRAPALDSVKFESVPT